MSRRVRPMAIFLLMLWLPPGLLFVFKAAGCSEAAAESGTASFASPAPSGRPPARSAGADSQP